MANDHVGTVALVWRGNREMREAAQAQKGRLGPLFDAMTQAGLAAEPAVYLDEMIDDVRAQAVSRQRRHRRVPSRARALTRKHHRHRDPGP